MKMDNDIILVKQRYGIVGFDPVLLRAIETALRVAPTNLSVLIMGESGVGKENFAKIIHDNSSFKNGKFIAVNCGAIPEGTIDSELFGHEKGAFTNATDARKGYFEEANNGTIFLDEVGDLPFSTQVRLLRVLETGEFMRVGSSKTLKTQVRVVAATNANMQERIESGRFRDDLFYRLNTISIFLPPLRERQNDIQLLFDKFASDIAEQSRVPVIKLDAEASELLKKYYWPGNIRQLKHVVQNLSVVETERLITADILQKHLNPTPSANVPVRMQSESNASYLQERKMILEFLYELNRKVTDLEKKVVELSSLYNHNAPNAPYQPMIQHNVQSYQPIDQEFQVVETEIPEHQVEPVATPKSFSLLQSEKDMIKKALEKHKNNRKNAASELGISERTLYRKIKEYGL